MRNLPCAVGVSVVLCLPAVAHAVDDETKPFAAELDLSYAKVQGDSEASTLSGETNLEWNQPKWRELFHALAYHQRQDSVTSAERYEADGQVDYKFNERQYTYVNAGYRDDRFSGYAYEAFGSAGFGWTLIDTDTTLLNVDTGPGYRYRKLENPDTADSGAGGGELIYRASGRYETDLTETLTFRQGLEMKIGRDSTQTSSKTELLNKMTDHLSLKITYALDHDTNVPEGSERTNTRLMMGVSYHN